MPQALRQAAAPNRLAFPRTGLPRDPYALRPHHLDAARAILDAAIEALDRRMAGALTKGQRHRREPVRVVHPPIDRTRHTSKHWVRVSTCAGADGAVRCAS